MWSNIFCVCCIVLIREKKRKLGKMKTVLNSACEVFIKINASRGKKKKKKCKYGEKQVNFMN